MTGNGSGRWRPRTFKVTFEEGHTFEGLEVTMRPASVDALFGMYDSAAKAGGRTTAAQKKAFRDLCADLARYITGWNVVDEEGNAVMPDLAGLTAQEPLFVTEIFTAWAERMVAVESPLPSASPNGRQAEAELAIPMTPSPPS